VVALAFTACGTAPDQADGPASARPPLSSIPVTPGSAGAGDPYYPTDGNGGYDVTGYQVSVSYDPADEYLEGDTTITSTANAQLTRFNLDLDGFDITSVEVDGAAAGVERTGNHELVVTPATPVAADATFTTRVRYEGEAEAIDDGTLGKGGWQHTSSGGIFVAGEPHSATSWFPANDTPKDKATFRLEARVPNGWSVISNGREEPSTSADGWTTFRWNEPTRIATYLTTIGIEKWTFERGTLPDGTPVVSAYAPGAEGKKELESRLPEVLAFLAEKFGPYPQSAAGGIYLNESIGFSLEIQGRPIYAKWVDLPTVVHENAHQWWGDSVSIENWADICLNECFASYATWLWDEAKEGANLDDRFRAEVTRAGSRFWRPLYDMGVGNEFTAVYDKGPIALHALRRHIGDDVFNRVLREWPAAHRDGNASWPQFEEFVTERAGRDLKPFFDAWFRGSEEPPDELLYPGSLRK
jgi:aminopeptidase N